ncbi:MAG TPA: helix-turn-helix transcriptional regulator [Puia sp.]
MTSFIGMKKFYETVNAPRETVPQHTGQFNIFRVEDLLLPERKQITYSRRDFYKVSLVTGESNIHYADRTVHITESVLVFTNPLIPFFWERVSPRHSGFVCIFTETFFNSSAPIKEFPVLQSASAGVIPLSGSMLGTFHELFEKMYAELRGDYVFKYDLCRHLLMEVVHTAQKLQPEAGQPIRPGTAAERITGLFMELLERQFPIELTNQVVLLTTPAGFAKQLNLHVNHLNKALKETTGRSTGQLINSRLAEEAKILLRSTGWTVNEIAWSLGFKEPNHFSTFFKSAAGVTPRQFRSSAGVS